MDQHRPPVWQLLVAVGLGLWTVGVTVLAQVAVYLLDTVSAVLYGTFGSGTVHVAITVVAAGLVAGPTGLASALPLTPGVRVTLRVWALAGAASALLGAARLAPLPYHELYLGGLAAAALLAAAVLARWRGWRRPAGPVMAAVPAVRTGQVGTAGHAGPAAGAGPVGPAAGAGPVGPAAGAGPAGHAEPAAGAEPAGPVADDGSAVASRRSTAAIAGGMVVLLPWALTGALGGLVETLLAAAAAAAIGWLAAVLLTPVSSPRRRGRWHTTLTGLVAGIVLVPIAGSTGGPGVALAALLVLPSLGFAVAVLRGRGTGILVALAAVGPLAFVDPEETSPILGTTFEVGFWAFIAAVSAFLVAVLLAPGYALAARTAAARTGAARRPRVAAGLVAALTLGVVAVHAFLGQPGLHGDRLFVVLADQADLTGLDAVTDRAERVRQTYRRLVEHAERTQADLRADLRRYHVGFRPYYLLNGIEVDAGPALRAWLAARPGVSAVYPSPVLRPIPVGPDPLPGGRAAPEGPQWNIQQIRADRAWEFADARGAGIVVGTSDSGVDGNHPALESAFRGGDDSWYDPWNDTVRPTDNGGHGTHTLGTVLGRGGIGVAPDASWIGCVNLDRNLGSMARYLDCLQFMLAPFPRHGDAFRDGRPGRAPHVLTNSWGCPELEGCERPGLMRPAVAALTAAGIFVVAAAGNSGDAGCRSITDEPATDPRALTVGAVSRGNEVAGFSSRGPVPGADKPDVVAPGVAVVSAVPGGGYRGESGTSMAAPHVAGVVALMWSANPRLIGDIGRTADILRSTARVGGLTVDGDECGDPRRVYGAGLVDALAAVTAARAIGP